MRIEDHYAEILRRTGSSPMNLRHRGLTVVLKDRFYFDYKFQGRTTGGGGGESGPGRGRANGKNGGMSRGRVVDHQVKAWIKRALSREQKRKNPEATKKHDKLHAFSRAFIELTRRMRLRPIGTQVVVRNDACDLATLVDAVFLDERNKVVLVELKCGFEGYLDKANARMKPPFVDVPNSPRYQHQLQLCFTRHMFRRTFPEFGQVNALIVRMTETGAHVTPIDQRIETKVKKLMEKEKPV